MVKKTKIIFCSNK